jgi:secreted PhoX family phosphatase
VKPVVQVTGLSDSEIAGPAFSPDGTRLYFSSQRQPGKTYEVTGPFAPAPPVPLGGRLSGGLFAGVLGLAALLALRRSGLAGQRQLPPRSQKSL